MDDHGGRVPDKLADLLALPGVGAYTARAVMAFAFEADVGVVDTNAGRVLSRAVAGRRLTRAEAQALVDAMVPPGTGWLFGQSLLDLGAMVCAGPDPACHQVPVRRRCRWAAAGRPDPDPARGSAGVSVAQSAFHGSDRQGRGRLVDALRHGPVQIGGPGRGHGLARRRGQGSPGGRRAGSGGTGPTAPIRAARAAVTPGLTLLTLSRRERR